MTRPLDVLIVVPHAVHGGQEEWLLQMLRATDRLLPRAILLQEGPMEDLLVAAGVPVDVMPVGRRPSDLPVPIARLAARLRRDPPEVVLANGVKAQFVAGPAARLAGVPEVFARHDHSFEGLAAHLSRWADGVVGTTEEVISATGRADAVVVHPPLPPLVQLGREAARRRLAAHGLDERDLLLGMCTRLVAYKGVDDAIEALARARKPSWRLVVVGGDDPAEPTERARLLALAAERGVSERVHLLGFIPQAAELIGAFDAVAVLTKTGGRRDPGREGFGMTALEASAAGVPVIAVGGGAIERRLAGRAGIVVPMAAPEAVAEALEVLTTADVRKRQGDAGRALVGHHPSAEVSAGRLAGVLAAVARRPGAGTAPAAPVSVVVPVFNEGKGVAALVRSVEPQLRPGDELIVVDDGSQDGSADLLRALAADRRHLSPLCLAVNVGPAGARNAGIAAAKHSLVVCTDAGVDRPSGWLDAMRTALTDRPDVDLVTGAWTVSATSRLQRAMAAALHPDIDDARRPGPLIRLNSLLFGRSFDARRPAGRSLAVQRHAWTRVGGFPEALRAREDVTFGLAVAEEGRCVLQLDEPVCWRQHDTLRQTARMYFHYGRGDGQQREVLVLGRNAVRAAASVAAPLMLFGPPAGRRAVAVGALLYYGLPAWRLRGSADPVRTASLVPLVMAVKDVAKAAGCLTGVLEGRGGACSSS